MSTTLAPPSVRSGNPLHLITGGIWILIGLLANEWVIAYDFAVDSLGPLSRILIWVMDLAFIFWGGLSICCQHMQLVANLNLLFITTICMLFVVESTLRLFPKMLGEEYANGVLTKYSTRPNGIYYKDPALDMLMMIPNYRTEMYYNGYTWIHETDHLGFRNPSGITKADIILLGDSFIYGHGVNIDQTVGHYLREFTGLPVVNMARQGDTSLTEAFLLTEFIDQFRPKYVFYFFYENDIRDLYIYRKDVQLQNFIDTPIKGIKYARRLDVGAALKIRDDENRALLHSGSLFGNLSERLYLLKILNWIKLRQVEDMINSRSSDALHDVNNEESLGWRYTKHAIRYMNFVCRTHNSEFVIVPITPDNKKHSSLLGKFAKEESIAFINAGIIDRSNQSLFLAVDGHFSAKGAKTMAGLVAEYLQQK